MDSYVQCACCKRVARKAHGWVACELRSNVVKPHAAHECVHTLMGTHSWALMACMASGSSKIEQNKENKIDATHCQGARSTADTLLAALR